MTTSEVALGPTPTVRLRRRRRWPKVVATVVVVIAALLIASSFVHVSEYALVPGDATPVSPLIKLPPAQEHALHGRVLLTDVGVNTNLTLLGLFGAWISSDTTIVSSEQLTGNLPVSEFDAQGTVDMEESELTAEAVALRQLGYPVAEQDVGVTVYVIDPGSPAWRSLHIGDVITSLNGAPTTNPSLLQAAVRKHQPGDEVTLQVGSISHPTPGHAVSIRLGKTVANGATIPFIGIGDPNTQIPGLGTQPSYQLPFAVHINSDQIGGPSAGLAWTLGIIDSLSGGGLTGGRTIAATGTIHPDGTIGDVGGVRQKTVAVERGGASVFFVPDVEVPTAQSMASGGLKVYGVSSLQQALHDLQQLGGSLGSASSGPPAGPSGHSVPFDWQDSPWT